MNKLNVATAMFLGSLFLALGAVSSLGLYPKISSVLAGASSPVTVISFEEKADEVITAHPGVIAMASSEQP